MLPLYAARIEDLGLDDFVKVDCAACHHVALLTPGNLLRVGPQPRGEASRLQGAVSIKCGEARSASKAVVTRNDAC
jgi:hypothetical protein